MVSMLGVTFLDLNSKLFDKENAGEWRFYGLSQNKDSQFEALAFGSGTKNLIYYITHVVHSKVGYIIYNFKYTSPTDKIQRLKRLFIMWAPQSAHVKERMKITMYAKIAHKILSMGTSFNFSIQANCTEDVSKRVILDKIKQNSTVF